MKGVTMKNEKSRKRMLPFSELVDWVNNIVKEIERKEEEADWERSFERTLTWNLH